MKLGRVLVTGGSGYFGQYLVPIVLAQAPDALIYTHFSKDPLGLPQGRRLDIRSQADVHALVDTFRPEVIIHTAGSNRQGEMMDDVIRLGANHITDAARAQDARLIHLSTDVIFDGRNAPYREGDPPRPLHAYGRAKAAAEQTVRGYRKHAIVRTSLIYGLDRMDHGTRWVREALKAGKSVTLFTDQLRNPVWAPALSRACLELALKACVGTLHVAGAQQLSRAAFGQRMLDWWGVTERDGLHFGPSDPSRWPQNCTLDISRATRLLQTPLPGVDAVLAGATRRRDRGMGTLKQV